MKEKSFIRWLGSADRSRQFVVFDEGRIVQFTVQYETFITGEWKPVVRYDTAHGFAHKDLLSLTGETEKKTSLSSNYNDAFTNAELDIKMNWQRYKDEYLRKMRG